MARNENDRDRDTDIEVVRPASLSFDPAKYRAEVDGFDITEVQKQELLLTLWSIMRSFVELGFSADIGGAMLDGLMTIPDSEDLS